MNEVDKRGDMAPPIKNVVLIAVDALRVDRTGVYSDDNLTPNIDSLANDGEVFEQCFSCANATDASVTTILTGLYPTHHGITNHGERITKKEQQSVAGTTSLPELLNSSHNTVGIDILERWHQRGFNTYINPRQNQTNSRIQRIGEIVDQLPSSIEKFIRRAYGFITSNDTPLAQSDVITTNTLDSIGTEDSPFFLFTHYWDAHIPYIPLDNIPAEIRNRTYDREDMSLDEALEPIKGSPWANHVKRDLLGDADTVSDIKQKYDAGVWNADQGVGKIIAELKEQGIYEETAVIVTADHGESFTEHGIFFDHHGLYDPTIHVPLIIKAPGFEGRESQFVQHFDLVPTILDLLNKDYREEGFDGKSLAKGSPRTLNRDAVFGEEGHTARKRMVRTKSYKYIKRLDDREKCRYCEISHANDEELYNIETDPGEIRNIMDKKVEKKVELNERLDSWIDQLPEPTEGEATFGASQEVKDHLEEMGYM
jgi:arylsulfatase A-like enzyme